MSSLSIISSDDKNRGRTIQSKSTSIYWMGFWTRYASRSDNECRSKTEADVHIRCNTEKQLGLTIILLIDTMKTYL